MRESLKLSGATLIVSLATWYLFYVYGMPLTRPDIAVVTGFWLVVVLVARRLWRRARKAA